MTLVGYSPWGRRVGHNSATNTHKSESTQRNSLFKREARQRYIPGEKVCVVDPEYHPPAPPPQPVRWSTPALNHSYRALFPSLLWPIIWLLPGSESLFGLTRGLPLCVCASLSQDGFQGKGFWEEEHIMVWCSLPSLTYWGTFLHMCSQRGLFDLKNEKYVVSLSSIQVQAGLSSSLFLPLSLSWSICPQRISAAQPGAHLSGTSVVLITQEI